MSIDIRTLPREIRDIIELRESQDPTFSRFCDEDYSEIFWNKLAERANPGVEHSIIISTTGVQGVGKSMSAIAMCCFLDPAFSVDRIFFGYDALVNARQYLKPNCAVLVDEQSQVFGLDSHRINIVLQNLKEQLRKKSIHFIFCAPVLYPESATSMYIIEAMFIDYENREVVAALKTREGLTLGHIRIPHPLKQLEDGSSLATKELIVAYEAKKDAHLEKILGRRGEDEYEVRANMVINNPVFKQAEKIYLRKMGYIPQATVVQIVNRLYPEYQAGVVPLEIAGRIKLIKELSGKWDVAGRKSKK